MKKISAAIILLVGLYSLLRNNIFKIDDQILWITSPSIFEDLLVPLSMALSSLLFTISKEKKISFYVAFGSMLVDFAMRLSQSVNHFYVYLTCEPGPIPESISSIQTIRINHWENIWPSHVMAILELIVLLSFIFLKKNENS